MKKLIKIFSIIAVFAGVVLSQGLPQGNFDVDQKYAKGVEIFQCTFTDVDSADLVSGLKSDVFDWSNVTSSYSSTVQFAMAYTTTSANDTLKVLLYGYDPLTENYNLIDTLGLTLLSTTNGGTTTYGTLSMSATNGWSPYVQLKIIQKAATNDQADDGTFEVSLWAAPVSETYPGGYKWR